MTAPAFKNPIIRWLDHRLPVFSFMHHELYEYPTPRNLSYWWNYGSLAGFMLVVMMVTGIVLAMHYTPHTTMAFDSVERIMRDVNYGWLIRYLHMNGGSMFFIVVYIHIFRGLYYGSYKTPRELLWIIGIVILLLMMATAFMGYVLPWGQMSFWGAKVITSFFTAIPFVGESLTQWLWGGFSVDNPTLNRFYSLHYLMPFVILGAVVVHILALHRFGSNNPLGIDIKGPQDSIPFHPYYTVKDNFGIAVFMIFYLGFVFFAPNFFGEPDNYIPANPLQTPPHIVPEWYFLPYYAILRAVDDNFIGWAPFGIVIINAKLAGVIAMFASIAVFVFLPWLDRSPVKSCRFRPVYKWFFWIFLIDCLILGWVGANPPDGVWHGIEFVTIGRLATIWYFLHVLILTPAIGIFEKPLPLPRSIGEAVIKGGAMPAGAHAKTMEKA